jgi:hypothetical protein
MGYYIGTRGLPLDIPWEYKDVQYPANWLRLSSSDDRAALGITWGDVVEYHDQKFYWGYDADGILIPKTYTDLQTNWVAQTKHTANTMLAPSDWRVIKAKESGKTMNAGWKTWRQVIRTECGTKVTAIEDCSKIGDVSPHADLARVQALAEYVTGSAYSAWTADPDNVSE